MTRRTAREIDTFETMKVAFAETTLQVKQLQLAWYAVVNSATGEAMMNLVNVIMAAIIKTMSDLIVLVLQLEQGFKNFIGFLEEKFPFLIQVGEAIGGIMDALGEGFKKASTETGKAITDLSDLGEKAGEAMPEAAVDAT